MEKQEMVDIICKTIGQKWMLYNWRLQEVTNPVMIWDVLDWIEKNIKEENINDQWWKDTAVNHLLNIYNSKRKPIEDQSELCIKFIYELVST